jgi:hypothetical protein
MVTELAGSLPNWDASKRTRCFAHIINLVAKSLLKQFDVITGKKPAEGEKESAEMDISDDEREFQELAAGLDEEERQMLEELDDADDDDMEGDDDDIGWVDELADMNERDREDLLKKIKPVSWVLFKVCLHDYLPFVLTTLLASKACLQNNPLHYRDYPSLASLEILSESGEPCDHTDAARCLDTMELYA